MSGRGTITSRTTVSPNSMIEWMSSRSSRSIDVLVGGDVGHRAELLLGDERALLQALAREHDVGEADEQPRDEHAQRREVRDEPRAAA